MSYRFTDEHLLAAIEQVVNNTTRVAGGEAIVSAMAVKNSAGLTTQPVDELRRLLPILRAANEKCKDLKYLTEEVVEVTGQIPPHFSGAVNPRPLSYMLWRLTIVMEASAWSKCYNSPQIRLLLHWLLNLLDHSGLPAYDKDPLLQGRDAEVCFKQLGWSEKGERVATPVQETP
jgi:hypothetical protein